MRQREPESKTIEGVGSLVVLPYLRGGSLGALYADMALQIFPYYNISSALDLFAPFRKGNSNARNANRNETKSSTFARQGRNPINFQSCTFRNSVRLLLRINPYRHQKDRINDPKIQQQLAHINSKYWAASLTEVVVDQSNKTSSLLAMNNRPSGRSRSRCTSA